MVANHDKYKPLLKAEGLQKKYSSSSFSFELHVPKFSVNAGEFVAVVGESGCGKSTLLDLFGLVLSVDYSTGFEFSPLQNKCIDISKPSRLTTSKLRRKHIGYILQNGGLLSFLSLRKNIVLPLSLSSKSRKNKTNLEGLAKKLGIFNQLDKLPGKVSGGERQRAAIARALIHRPPLILADEPTSALDPQRSISLMKIFHQLAKESRCAVIMVTHNHKLAGDFADRIYSFSIEKVGEKSIRSYCYESTSEKLSIEHL